jgi:AbrB family looped-hinge helix DNA binding protein
MSTKGRLVVPARIRRRFNIKPGTRIVFLEENGRIILQPVTRQYIHSFCGIFKLKPGEKSAVQELREDRTADRMREDRKAQRVIT